MSSSRSEKGKEKVTAFISFPSPYTQTLLISALVSTLPELSISLIPPTEDDPPKLQWADYDLIAFEKPRSNPSDYLTSSYIYRKALIRKHQLHRTIIEYLAKCEHRQTPTSLKKAWPNGWSVELQFADELDELWIDDLYELGEALERNEELEDGEKKWFILKPGFADRAQGIRLFSTKQELEEIFEAFEGDDEDDELDMDDQLEKFRNISAAADEAISGMANREPRDNTFDEKLDRWKKMIENDSGDDEEAEGSTEAAQSSLQRLQVKHTEDGDGRQDGIATSNTHVAEDEEENDDRDTGVMTSQLRHFLIQEYVTDPMLFDIAQQANVPNDDPSGYKFHLRAYVLLSGAYQVHVSRTMLALFSGTPYSPPTSSNLDLNAQLTNTCLQTDAFGAPAPPEHLIKLFWDLEGLSALRHSTGDYESQGGVTKEWLERTFDRVGDVIGESIRAGAECGSFNLQLVPNAFEIFGVDLLLSTPTVENGELGAPQITLLEYNASPDFHQSGMNLRPQLLEMFKGVVDICVAPFFGVETVSQSKGKESQDDLREAVSTDKKVSNRYGWSLVAGSEIMKYN